MPVIIETTTDKTKAGYKKHAIFVGNLDILLGIAN